MKLTVSFVNADETKDKVYEIDSLDEVEDKLKEYFEEYRTERVVFTLEGVAVFQKKVLLSALFG